LKISLRKVKKSDWDYILKLRNSKEFRNNFYQKHTISKKEHYDYLKRQESNPDFYNWIICYDNNDAGYIRILANDISIMIEPKFHNKGIGTKAVQLIEKEAKKLGIRKLVGKVMVDNKTSEKIFIKNHYNLLMYWYEKDLNDKN